MPALFTNTSILAVMGNSRIKHVFHLICLADICLNGYGISAQLIDRFYGLFASIFTAVQ